MYKHKSIVLSQTRKIRRAYKELTGDYYRIKEEYIKDLSAEEIENHSIQILKEIAEIK